MTAYGRGWGEGWPADRRADMVKVESGGVVVLVNAGIAPLVKHALDAAPDCGYTLKPGECWGYANRPIRGSTTASNHSWGLAVDINSRSNPMSPTLITDIPASYVAVWKELGFRWGGDYTGRKDAMHFEFMGTPADAHQTAAKFSIQKPEPAAAGVRVLPMFDPPQVLQPVAASMTWPHGGFLLLAVDGSVYTYEGAPFLGSANGKPYFAGREAAAIEYRPAEHGGYGEGYTITDTAGEQYRFDGGAGQ